MLKTFCIALVFVAAGTVAGRAQNDSTTDAGSSVEQNAPQTVTHRSISQRRSPAIAEGTLIRGFTLSAPPPWHPHVHAGF
jgi:hypothetical protein